MKGFMTVRFSCGAVHLRRGVGRRVRNARRHGARRPGRAGIYFGRLDARDQVLQLGVGHVLLVDRLHRVDEGLLVDLGDLTPAFGDDLVRAILLLRVPQLALLGDAVLGGLLERSPGLPASACPSSIFDITRTSGTIRCSSSE